MTDSKQHPAVGIDLGTTFSAVAYLNANGRPETIRNAEGDLTTPSAVFFDHSRPIIGVEAVEAGLLEPDRLALYAKRDVGEDRYGKQILGGQFPPEVLQALVLRKLKADSELLLGNVEKVVVTVPAFFNEPCRKATQDAGRIAGLEVMDIINEPTAAAITFGVQTGFLNKEGVSGQTERVLVYDLGGGTFDVTVMEIQGNNYNTIATAGDVYLGGVDWDRRLVDHIAEQFMSQHGVDPREDPCGEQELLRKANQAKHALTQRDSFSVAFAHEGMRLRSEVSQDAFSNLCEDLVERTLMTVGMVLDDSHLKWTDLTRLILVGGSTRMPMIRSELEKRSGLTVDRSLSPDEAVCHGAALYAGMLLGNTSGKHANVSVSNVNSHDLGVLAVHPATGEPARQVMIPRNTTLPARKQIIFRTHADNQANVKINVIEGGDDRGVGSTDIGKCIVNDLPAGTPKGTEVAVQFDYSQDGRLTVCANLPSVELNMEMTLDRAAGLSSDEIQTWIGRIDGGLSDETLGELRDDSDQLLPDDQPVLGTAPLPLPDGSPFEAIPMAEVIPMAELATPADVNPMVAAKAPTPFPAIKPVGKAKPVAKPVVQAKPLVKPVGKVKPVAKAKPVVKPVAKATPVVKATPTAKPIAKATPVAKVNPVAPVAKPVAKVPVAKAPVAKPVAKAPVAKANPVVNPVAKPVARPVARPVAKPTGKAQPKGKPHMADFPVTPKVTEASKGIPRPAKKTDAAPLGNAPVGKAPVGKAPVGKAPVGKAPVQPVAQPEAKKPAGKKPIARPGAIPKPGASAKPAKPAAKSKPVGPKIDLGDSQPKPKIDASEIPDFTEIGGAKPKAKVNFKPVIVTDGGNKKAKKPKRKKDNEGEPS